MTPTVVQNADYGLCLVVTEPDEAGVVQLVQLDGLPVVAVYADALTGQPAQPAAGPAPTEPEPAPQPLTEAAAEPAQPA